MTEYKPKHAKPEDKNPTEEIPPVTNATAETTTMPKVKPWDKK